MTKKHLPGLNSARVLSHGRWASARGTTLRVVGACPIDASCTPAHQLTAREAFRAWPVAHGIILQARYLPASALATHLRAWLPRAQYGLIVTAADLQPRPAPRVAAAARRLHKRLKRLEPKYAEYLDELLSAADPRPVDLPIGAGEVWVVPRLSGLGQLKALRGAVYAAVAALPVRWLSPPP